MRSFTRLTLARLLYTFGLTASAFALSSRLKGSGETPKGTDLLRARCRLREGRHHEAYEMLKEEMRLHPSSWQADKLLRQLACEADPPKNSDDAFEHLLEVVRPYTMMSEARLRAIYTNARRICEEDLEGNFVECGVAAGGSSALLAHIIKKYTKRPRLLYCFDTFEGMPRPTSADVHRGVPADATGWGTGTCAAPMASLTKVVDQLDAGDVVRPVKGLFCETLPQTRQSIGEIALLHLDGDWYESTRDILLNLYDLVLTGGYLQVDDYGHWEGCRKALDEFEAERGVRFEKTVLDETGISFLKP